MKGDSDCVFHERRDARGFSGGHKSAKFFQLIVAERNRDFSRCHTDGHYYTGPGNSWSAPDVNASSLTAEIERTLFYGEKQVAARTGCGIARHPAASRRAMPTAFFTNAETLEALPAATTRRQYNGRGSHGSAQHRSHHPNPQQRGGPVSGCGWTRSWFWI